MTTINLIPSNYVGNPHNALGYAWESLVMTGYKVDQEKSIPGHDVIVYADQKKGIEYKDAAKAKMIELGVTVATINCMWCGGWSGDMDISGNADINTINYVESAGEENFETAAFEKMAEKINLDKEDVAHKNNAGYCTKCHSYCYGDCTASQY